MDVPSADAYRDLLEDAHVRLYELELAQQKLAASIERGEIAAL